MREEATGEGLLGGWAVGEVGAWAAADMAARCEFLGWRD